MILLYDCFGCLLVCGNSDRFVGLMPLPLVSSSCSSLRGTALRPSSVVEKKLVSGKSGMGWRVL